MAEEAHVVHELVENAGLWRVAEGDPEDKDCRAMLVARKAHGVLARSAIGVAEGGGCARGGGDGVLTLKFKRGILVAFRMIRLIDRCNTGRGSVTLVDTA